MSRLAKFAWATLVVNVAVVVYGAYVRATGSGAGCGPSWPTCDGQIIPAEFDSARVVEFTHRVTSGIAAVMVAVLAIWVLRTFAKGHQIRTAAWLSGIFIISESLVGAVLVLAEWVADDASAARTVMVPVHLVNTFVLLGSLAMLAWWASDRGPVRIAVRRDLAGYLGFALLGVMVISATGGVTALADTLFPSESIADGLSEAVGDAEHFLTRLRVIHPVVAVALGAFTGWVAWTFGVDADKRVTQRLAMIIIGMVAVQFFVGMANIVLGTPVWLQLTHLTLADLLWLALVFFGASSLELDRTPA
ncbi:MAG: COX15/CtaA family protein [Acidimicrobiia bacterium]